MCPDTTIYVTGALLSSPTPRCIFVLILLYICVLILLCVLRLLYVSSYYYICVLILLYVSSYYFTMSPHTTIHVSSYYYVSSYYHTCVLILLYMCPHAAICVGMRSILLYICRHTSRYSRCPRASAQWASVLLFTDGSFLLFTIYIYTGGCCFGRRADAREHICACSFVSLVKPSTQALGPFVSVMACFS